MRLVFMGTPEWAVPSLEALLESGHEITGVLTQPDRRAGRNKMLKPSPVKQKALACGVKVFSPEKAGSKEFLELLHTMRPDLLMVCAYGKILPQTLLDIPPKGCFNVHFSKLPRWRGASPVQAAILAGDRETGVTLQRMLVKLDAGPLVGESPVETILADDTSETLGNRLSFRAGMLVRKTLPLLLKGTYAEFDQDQSKTTFCRLIRKEQGRATWQEEEAETLERKLRAFTPWPGLFCFSPNSKRLQIIKARVVASELEAGRVGEGLVIGTKKGGLQVLRLREEGKKELDAEAFLKGHPWLLGSILN